MKTNDLHIELPASKSLSNRWLLLNHILGSRPNGGGLEGGLRPNGGNPEKGLPFMIRNLSDSDDTQLMAALLAQLRHGTADSFYCRNAGTVARFMLALLAVTPGHWHLTGDERLKQRPIEPLIRCLRDMGCDIVCTEAEGHLPVDITGFTPQFKMAEIDPSESSQYVSAMMLIGCLLPNGLTLTLTDRAASRPYIEMTCAVLTQAGLKNSVSPNRRVYRVEALPTDILHRQQVINIEPDWSSASYIYAAACLVPGMRIRMPGLSYSHSSQGDRVVKDIFAQLGVVTQELRSPYRTNTRSIAITATGVHPEHFEYNFIDCPDILPAVLVTCAALGIRAHLRGIKNLRLKESDRISALQEELEKMGSVITHSATEIRLLPAVLNPTQPVGTHGDHRIAMAFGILTLRFPDLVIQDPDQVSKSFPEFWRQLDIIKKAAKAKTKS